MLNRVLCAALIAALLPATQVHAAGGRMVGESLVLAGETPGALLGETVDPASVVVRATYGAGGTVYEAGRDYRFDERTRTIARLPGSRIPDFSTNVLFGQK